MNGKGRSYTRICYSRGLPDYLLQETWCCSVFSWIKPLNQLLKNSLTVFLLALPHPHFQVFLPDISPSSSSLGHTFRFKSQMNLYSSVGKESACNTGDPSLIPRSERSTGEGIGYPLQHSWASLVTQLVKNLPAMQRPGFDPWVGKMPWKRDKLPFQPIPVFWPGEFHGLYSPWGRKESDTTEILSLSGKLQKS